MFHFHILREEDGNLALVGFRHILAFLLIQLPLILAQEYTVPFCQSGLYLE